MKKLSLFIFVLALLSSCHDPKPPQSQSDIDSSAVEESMTVQGYDTTQNDTSGIGRIDSSGNNATDSSR